MSRENPQRIGLFESLRGLLSFWVLFAHIGLFAGLTPDVGGFLKPLEYFNYTAGYAVYVFMILSGFVISFLLDKGREGYGRFIFRRFFRLYPVFAFAFVLGILLNPMHQYIHSHASWNSNAWIRDQLVLAQNDWNYLYAHVLTHLPMLHGVVPDRILPMTDAAFSGPGWSISTEWQYYLLAPLLFRLIARPAGLTIFAVFVLLCFYLPGQFPFIGDNIPRACVFAQIHWFFLGMAFFHWYKGFAGFSTGEKLFYQAVTLAIVLNLAIHPTLLLSLCIWLFFFWLVVWGREHPEGRAEKMAQFFNNPLLKYLGRISYPVYLLHWPVVILVSRVVLAIDPQIDRKAAYAVFIVVVPLATVGLAHIVHRYIEQPGIDFARNFRANGGRARTVATENTAPFLNEIQRKEP